MNKSSVAKKIQDTEERVGENVLEQASASEDFLELDQGTKRFMEITTAIALSLPCIGMITGGLSTGREDIALMGVAGLIIYAVMYYIVLHLLLTYEV
ncbi:MAG: hypothetical protein ACREQX_00060 [Candidatus Binataceae bacterium]